MNKIISSLFLLLVVFSTHAQNVGINTNNPHPSAALDVSSTNSGFLPPRMSITERNGINNPAVGLMIYNTTTDCLEIFGKGKWNSVYCLPVDTTTVVDSTLATDIDGHTYPTVKICDQTWMAKNLDVARYRNGDIIPQVTDPTEWANLTTGAWCWYNNDSATYGSVYGRLYNWYAVNDPRGLAPEGWHVPSDDEYTILSDCLGGDNVAGAKLKEAGTAHWNSPNTGATNETGFNGLPGGFRTLLGTFMHIGNYGYWWTTKDSNNTRAWFNHLVYDNSSIIKYGPIEINFGFSVRCIKDTPITTLNNGLVAYYPFNGNANDESGNGNNGTVNGATLTTDRFGNSGKAYSFDGVSNYIQCLSPGPTGITNLSISFWMNTSMLVNDSYNEGVGFILGYGGIGIGGGALIINVNGSAWAGGCSQAITYDSYGAALSKTDIFNNTWNFYTIINDTLLGDNVIYQKIYKNGNLMSQTCFSSSGGNNYYSTDILNTYPIRIGKYFGPTGLESGIAKPYFFNGSLDDIRIYNRALTQAEITYLATH
jgi:uncharacterized protein (TIGR02145 family)